MIYQFIIEEKIIYLILDIFLFVVVLRLVILFRKQIFCTFPCYIAKCWCGIENKIGLFSKLTIQVLGFLCAVIMLYQIWLQFELQTETLKTQTENTEKQFTAELYKNAVEHLGHEQQTVVLGGVHALHDLARNHKDAYSQQVFELLCSFIREKTAKPEYQAQILATPKSSDETKTPTPTATTPTISLPFFRQSDKPETPNQATSLIVIQTIVDKLFREAIELDEIDEKTGEKFILYRKYEANLSGAFLRGVDFTNASLRKANLQKVDLQGANLQGANLLGASLQGTNLSGANLQGAGLWNANLQRADLQNANLQGADLWNANLQGAKLSGADLRGVQCNSMNIRERIKDAIKDNTFLKTDLSIITLYDDDGNALDLDEDGKKAWFRERGAIVDDLTAEEVQELFKDFKWE